MKYLLFVARAGFVIQCYVQVVAISNNSDDAPAYPCRLVAVGLLGAVLLPLLQMLLAALYFKIGSPWSTVLNAKVNVFAWNAERDAKKRHSKLWNILFWKKDHEDEAEEVAHNGGADVEQNLAWLRRNSSDLNNLPMVRRGKSVDFDDQ